MVHWGWIPIALVIGVFLGMFAIAFMETARDDEKEKKWWEE